MDWIYRYISITAVIGGLGFLIKYLIQRKIDSYFNHRLEQHKQELAALTESIKYNLGKKMFDYEAYTSKKHLIYHDIYKEIYSTFSKLIVFHELIEKKFDIKELIKYDLGNQKNEFFQKKVDDYNEVIIQYRKTADCFTQNEIFCSKDVAQKSRDAIRAVQLLMQTLTDPKYYDKVKVNNELYESEKRIKELKEIIHKELSYSHFE
ncbi:hypothetical protein P5757_26540 [Bacillus tropicus]|uniref:hypothetical protein n=2 Tax=Bacillus tropicus TaxID=2026188 RepID=UPI000B4B7E5F|nr:hypothetical protein [Bacillus tropicus]MDF9592292.1 hypothetical protein [Bacillus tropicus]MDF9650227.1 hypothetical protein [Bacillus tropicus]